MPEVESSQCIAKPLNPLITWSKLAESKSSARSSPQMAADDAAAPAAAPVLKPEYICANQLDQVQLAWSLVYERYVEKGLIDENPFGIHTAPQAVGRHVCVIYGPSEHTFGSTLTLIGDNADGIPLDSVYGQELGDLRREGRGLVEVGLLADRRRSTQRGARALFDMMRWAAYYTLHIDSTDIVVGVHPHHARFYTRCFGFECFAAPTHYPLVNDNPVVPLRLPLREALAQASLPRGLAYVRDNPIPASEFSQRFMFEPEQLRGSMIERFLENRYDVAIAPEKTATGASLLDAVLPSAPPANLQPA